MWQYLKGVEEPNPNKRKSTEEKLEYFKQYDKQKKNNYNAEWEKSYNQLRDTENGMIYTVLYKK